MHHRACNAHKHTPSRMQRTQHTPPRMQRTQHTQLGINTGVPALVLCSRWPGVNWPPQICHDHVRMLSFVELKHTHSRRGKRVLTGPSGWHSHNSINTHGGGGDPACGGVSARCVSGVDLLRVQLQVATSTLSSHLGSAAPALRRPRCPHAAAASQE